MVLRTLRAEGLAPEALRVWDAEAMRRALEAQPFDIVISTM